MSKKKRKLKNTFESPFCNIVRRLIEYLNNKSHSSSERVGCVLYDDFIVGEIKVLNPCFTYGQALDELNKFITKIEPLKGIKVVGWLFKDRLAEQYTSENKKQKWFIGEKIVSTIKEIIWVSHYFLITGRQGIKLFGSPFERLNRILNVDLNICAAQSLYGLSKNKVLFNILSLGDARLRFLKYADNINPEDLEFLVLNNGLDENKQLLWAVRSLTKKIYDPYEHYHMFEFVRTLIEEAMYEKRIALGLS